MSKSRRRTLIKYGVTVLLGAGLVWLTLELQGYAYLKSDMERYRLLSNAFTIPGSILLMLGLLVLISSTGAYDGLTYALRWLRMTLLPFGASKHERYYDYVQRRRTRPKVHGGFLMVVGGAFLAVAVVFIFLFYRARP